MAGLRARPRVLPAPPAGAARARARGRLRRGAARARALAPLRRGGRDRSLRADARARAARPRGAEHRLRAHGRERARARRAVRLHREPHDVPPSRGRPAHARGAARPDRAGRTDRDRRRGLGAAGDPALALRRRGAARAPGRLSAPRTGHRRSACCASGSRARWLAHLASDRYLSAAEFRRLFGAALPGATFERVGALSRRALGRADATARASSCRPRRCPPARSGAAARATSSCRSTSRPRPRPGATWVSVGTFDIENTPAVDEQPDHARAQRDDQEDADAAERTPRRVGVDDPADREHDADHELQRGRREPARLVARAPTCRSSTPRTTLPTGCTWRRRARARSRIGARIRRSRCPFSRAALHPCDHTRSGRRARCTRP